MAKVKIPFEKWKAPKRIEQKYYTMIQKALEPAKKQIKNAKSVGETQEILEKLSKSSIYKKKSVEIARTIATMLFEGNEKTWRKAAAKASRGKEINTWLNKEMNEPRFKQMYEELLAYNATLIQTLPLDISKDVIKHISSKNLTGERASDISDEIKQFFPEHTRAKAELIARTETSKTSEAITRTRSELLGIKWYVWRTSEDRRVRSSHAHMEDVLINYSHPPVPEKLDRNYKGKKYPAPYNAGNIYNCRCYSEPLIDIYDINWPHKVYNWKTQKIETMTLTKFKEFSGIKED